MANKGKVGETLKIINIMETGILIAILCVCYFGIGFIANILSDPSSSTVIQRLLMNFLWPFYAIVFIFQPS
jgi:Na+/pantothenate symporter